MPTPCDRVAFGKGTQSDVGPTRGIVAPSSLKRGSRLASNQAACPFPSAVRICLKGKESRCSTRSPQSSTASAQVKPFSFLLSAVSYPDPDAPKACMRSEWYRSMNLPASDDEKPLPSRPSITVAVLNHVRSPRRSRSVRHPGRRSGTPYRTIDNSNNRTQCSLPGASRLSYELPRGSNYWEGVGFPLWEFLRRENPPDDVQLSCPLIDKCSPRSGLG
jgi:hypothetical protein